MCAIGFFPLLDEREKVFTVKRKEGSGFGRRKRQLLAVGESEISSVSCGQAINIMRCQCGSQRNRDVFSSKYSFMVCLENRYDEETG